LKKRSGSASSRGSETPNTRLSGVVGLAFGPSGPGFAFRRPTPLFYWVVTLGKLFTRILSSKKLGYKRE